MHEGFEIFGVDGNFDSTADAGHAPTAAIAACSQFGGRPVGNYGGTDCAGTVHVFASKPAGLGSSTWCDTAA